MFRPLSLIAIFSLCASEMQGRAATAPVPRDDREKSGAPEKAKPMPPRRVLFRTDSPRLFAPAIVKPVERPAPPIRRPRERPRIIVPAPVPRSVVPPPPMPVPERTPPAPPLTAAAIRRELDLQPTTFTPYDPYLGTVRSVIAQLDERDATMAAACELMREGRQFHYLAVDPYRPQAPAVTEARHAGDCKSKALWLYDHLGDPAAFFVIGKLQLGTHTSHAWVYWRNEGRWWILDPTDRFTPISADSVASNRYVPYYSYARSGKFRHKATSLMLAMANGIPAAPDKPAIAMRSRSRRVNPLEGQSRP
jgi:hypothetical protein